MNTPEGGKKVSATSKTKYGSDYYARIGAIGGKAKVLKGINLLRQTDPEKYKAARAKNNAGVKAAWAAGKYKNRGKNVQAQPEN